MTIKLSRREALVGAGALAAAGPALAQRAATAAPVPTPPPPGPDGLVQVLLHTDAGDITLALEAVKAPITTANFLKYVDGKRYDNGTIYRTMRSEPPPPDK